MDNQVAKNGKESVKALTGHNHQLRTFRSKSKDKLQNERPVSSGHINYKTNTKMPIVHKTPANQYNSMKQTERRAEKLDFSGDRNACSSKLKQDKTKKHNSDTLKPSLIPRRKTTTDSSLKEESNFTPRSKEHHFLGESRNVQRVQMLINQDYQPETHGRVATLARPIPMSTTGLINTQSDINTADIIIPDGNDWFVDIHTPANSLNSNLYIRSRQTYDAKDMIINNVNEVTRHGSPTSSSSAIGSSISPHKRDFYKEDRFSDGLSSDIEYPTRDNESGYLSISPPNQTPMELTSFRISDITITSKLNEIIEQKIDNLIRQSTLETKNVCPVVERTEASLKKQPTVLLAKISSTLVLQATSDNHDGCKLESNCTDKTAVSSDNNQPSSSNPTSTTTGENSQNQVPVASYVECPSEIHQKTTNFEEEDCECANSNTPSSMTGTDLESREDMSSQFTIGRDSCSATMDWCHQCCGSSYDAAEKQECEETTSAEDSELNNHSANVQTLDSSTKESVLTNADYNPFEDHYRYCWEKHHEERKHTKWQRFRRFPSSRYKLPKPLSAFRKRISVYFCSRRLSRVWKKTAQRWAIWSAKTPHRLKKRRVLLFFQRSMVWEDADVQTSTLIYTETGTDSGLKEQTSRAIMAFANFDWNFTAGHSRPAGCGMSSRYFGAVTCTMFTGRLKKYRELIPQPYHGISVKKSPFAKCPPVRPEYCSLQYIPDQKINSIHKQKVHSSPLPIGCENMIINRWKEQVIMKNESSQKADNPRTSIELTPDSIISSPTSQSKRKKSVADAANITQINEVTAHDKDTVTDNAGYPMRDNVTSTYLHLDDIRNMNNIQSNNANTQMYIVCNNAETDVRYPLMDNRRSASVFTAKSDIVSFCRPFGTNTVTHAGYPMRDNVTSTYLHLDDIRKMNDVQSNNANTQMYIVCNNAETDVRYPLMDNRRSASIFTAKSDIVSFCRPFGTNTDMKNQTSTKISTSSYLMRNFTSKADKMTSKSATPVKTVTASTSKKDFIDTALSAYKAGLKSGVCLTSPVLSKCQCTYDAHEVISRALSAYKAGLKSGVCLTSPVLSTCQCPCGAHEAISHGTDTANISMTKSNTANKLNTYFNAGMLINTLVEQAVQRCNPKLSVQTDTKSIGNKYASDIGTCTNTVLRDSVIGTEKELNPVRLSANTNTVSEQQSKFTEQPSVTVDRTKLITFQNGTQYSPFDHKGASFQGSERYGQSCLITTRSLSSSLEDVAVQTDIKMEPNKCYTSIFTSCTLDGLETSYHDKVIAEGQTNKEQTSQMISASKSSSCLNTGCKMNNAVLSSALDADKWMKAGIEKDFQELLSNECANKNSCSCDCHNNINKSYTKYVSSEAQCIDPFETKKSDCLRSQEETSQHVVENDAIENLTILSLMKSKAAEDRSDTNSISPKKQSREDLVPIMHVADRLADSKSDEEPNYQLKPLAASQMTSKQNLVQMVNNATSDVSVLRETKAVVPQACSEISDAATESLEAHKRKSASILTSRCILPSLSYCTYCENYSLGDLCGDCLFVYDKPRCVVHTKRTKDIAINAKPSASYTTIHNKLNVHTVGLSTCCFELKPTVTDKETSFVASVTSPRGTTSVHEKHEVRSVGMIASGNQWKPTTCDNKTSIPMDLRSFKASKQDNHEVRSVSVNASCLQPQRSVLDKKSSNISESLAPKVTFPVESKVQSVGLCLSKTSVWAQTSNVADLLSSKTVEESLKPKTLVSAEVMMSPDTQSESVMTSNCVFKKFVSIDQTTEPVGIFEFCSDYVNHCCNKVLEIPPNEAETVEDSVKTHIIASCRYYSSLITKHLDQVKENLARHLSPPTNTVELSEPEEATYTDACTMKPSAREDFGCQTFKHHRCREKYSILDQATSETDICGHDKEHLQSVYFMLTAIEGRMRRLKS